MTDMVTGWTENYSIRNNAAKWITEGIGALAERFPFELVIFDSDCGGEFINHEVAAWLQERDIEQTRSRPCQKNDQATVESKNNHVVRKHAFYLRASRASRSRAPQLPKRALVDAHLAGRPGRPASRTLRRSGPFPTELPVVLLPLDPYCRCLYASA
nr:transposase family protein [Janibacter corallicola]